MTDVPPPDAPGERRLPAVRTVVLDVDGTLVDSVYSHVLAWNRAFRAVGVAVPAWRLHRAIGMGGDRLVTEVAGQRVEDAVGDRLRQLHDEDYAARPADVVALPGADALLDLLHARGFRVVLASSGTKDQTERALGLLERADLVDGWVCSADVDRSKPAADLVEVALDRAGGGPALMVGDSVWDVAAAARAGLPTIGLRCGGFPERDLDEAGALVVLDHPQDLVDRADGLGLRRPP